jgi:hypothetical protein
MLRAFFVFSVPRVRRALIILSEGQRCRTIQGTCWNVCCRVNAPTLDGPARWYLFQGDRLLVDERGDALAIPTALAVEELGVPAVRTHYLGALTGAALTPCFSGVTPDDAMLPPGFVTHDLRALFEHFDEFEIGLAALQTIAYWDRPSILRRQRHDGTARQRMSALPSLWADQLSASRPPSSSRHATAKMPAILLARNHRFPRVATAWWRVLSRPAKRWRMRAPVVEKPVSGSPLSVT